MFKYIKDILTTFSMAQRIWALIILCVFIFLITFGSNLIELIKPDPIQQDLIIERQSNQIIYLNTQLDSSSIRIDKLTQKVIDGQNECTKKRLDREKEIVTQIDGIVNMIKNDNRPHQMVRNDGPGSSKPKIIEDTIVIVMDANSHEIRKDNSSRIIEELKNLKNKVKSK
jgi:hypothetical protein